MTQKIPSGIDGFDDICDGRFVDGSVNLVFGGPGCGKSLFSMRFIYNGALKYKHKGLYLSFDERREDLIEDTKEIGWDIEKLEEEDLIKLIYIKPYESRIFEKIAGLIDTFKPRRVVLDSISTLTLGLNNDYEIRKELYKLIELFKSRKCTTIFVSEASPEESISVSRNGIEEFVTDSVITLHYGGFGGTNDRFIRITKMRRSNHIDGPIPIELGNIFGIKVNYNKEDTM
jgi:circadian clock protein KaiC